VASKTTETAPTTAVAQNKGADQTAAAVAQTPAPAAAAPNGNQTAASSAATPNGNQTPASSAATPNGNQTPASSAAASKENQTAAAPSVAAPSAPASNTSIKAAPTVPAAVAAATGSSGSPPAAGERLPPTGRPRPLAEFDLEAAARIRRQAAREVKAYPGLADGEATFSGLGILGAARVGEPARVGSDPLAAAVRWGASGIGNGADAPRTGLPAAGRGWISFAHRGHALASGPVVGGASAAASMSPPAAVPLHLVPEEVEGLIRPDATAGPRSEPLLPADIIEEAIISVNDDQVLQGRLRALKKLAGPFDEQARSVLRDAADSIATTKPELADRLRQLSGVVRRRRLAAAEKDSEAAAVRPVDQVVVRLYVEAEELVKNLKIENIKDQKTFQQFKTDLNKAETKINEAETVLKMNKDVESRTAEVKKTRATALGLGLGLGLGLPALAAVVFTVLVKTNRLLLNFGAPAVAHSEV